MTETNKRIDECVEFITKFLNHDYFKKKEYKDNLEKLRDFSFLNLTTLNNDYTDIDDHTKRIYGNFIIKTFETREPQSINRNRDEEGNYYEDCDDMNLIRAIYYLIYHKTLPDISWNDIAWEIKYGQITKTLENKKYRGETINTFNTLINELDSPYNYKTFFKSDKELTEKLIPQFREKVFTVGNFMFLPHIYKSGVILNRKRGYTLNGYKGCCLGDYSDRFLKALKNKDDDTINKIIEGNELCNNFDRFIEVNYLQDYVENRELSNFEPHYTHYNNFDKDNVSESEKEEYTKFVRKYITNVTELINKRFDRIKKELEEYIR